MLPLIALVVGLVILTVGADWLVRGASRLAAALGNVLGSNLFNLLAVLGTTCALQPLAVDAAALQLELPLNLFAVALCLPLFFSGGRISRSEGALLLGFFAAYMVLQGLRVADSAALQTAQQGLWAACALAVVAVTVLAAWPGVRRPRAQSPHKQ